MEEGEADHNEGKRQLTASTAILRDLEQNSNAASQRSATGDVALATPPLTSSFVRPNVRPQRDRRQTIASLPHGEGLLRSSFNRIRISNPAMDGFRTSRRNPALCN